MSIFFEITDNDSELQGEPSSLKEVKKLCPNHFVRDTLFRISGRAKDSLMPVKLLDLKHRTGANLLFK